jgi:microcystin degradation protein MlrC
MRGQGSQKTQGLCLSTNTWLTEALLLFLVSLCCAGDARADQADGRSHRPLRIAIAFFQHEATTFSSETAGLEDFPKPDLVGAALLDHDDAVRGFVKYARENHDVELIPLRSPGGEPIGGSSKGWITREAYEHYIRQILQDLRAALPVDAVYLSLHGAAAVIGIPRPEADLARRVRDIVGARVPIAATFDPHGNQDGEFLRYANFALAMKYFPHYDGRLQGERAARLLIRTALGDYVPTTATRKPGIITPTVMQWTGQYPWINLVQRALTWEARESDAYVSVLFGYPWSDVPDVGATIQVMTNGNQALADRIAADMSHFMWRLRADFVNTTPIVQPREAVRQAVAAAREGHTPTVLADYSDRSGDATFILAEILKQDVGGVIFASLRDEHVIAALKAEGARPNDPFDREVGGFALDPASGKPVRIRGKLVYFGQPQSLRQDLGGEKTVAVVEFGRGNALVITPELVQVTTPEVLAWPPIHPERYQTWVLKSRAHFRRGFDDTGYARTIIIVDAPGPYLGTVHLDNLPYRNVDLKTLYPYGKRTE